MTGRNTSLTLAKVAGWTLIVFGVLFVLSAFTIWGERLGCSNKTFVKGLNSVSHGGSLCGHDRDVVDALTLSIGAWFFGGIVVIEIGRRVLKSAGSKRGAV